jgi:hypothetical protein
MPKKQSSAAKKTSSATKKRSSPASDEAAQFTVDLSTVKLSKREVSSLKNKFTKAAVARAAKPKTVARKKGEPYAKITFFKQTSPYARVVFAQAL